jgi:hypothetical protein
MSKKTKLLAACCQHEAGAQKDRGQDDGQFSLNQQVLLVHT